MIGINDIESGIEHGLGVLKDSLINAFDSAMLDASKQLLAEKAYEKMQITFTVAPTWIDNAKTIATQTKQTASRIARQTQGNILDDVDDSNLHVAVEGGLADGVKKAVEHSVRKFNQYDEE